MSDSVQRVEHINLQPVELTTSVEIAVGAKGERKPTVKASIKRSIPEPSIGQFDTDSDTVVDLVVKDVVFLKEEIRAAVDSIMKVEK